MSSARHPGTPSTPHSSVDTSRFGSAGSPPAVEATSPLPAGGIASHASAASGPLALPVVASLPSATPVALPSAASQHGREDPVNGQRPSTMAAPTIVNSNSANGAPSAPGGDHSRKSSVSFSAAGASGNLPNGGPAAPPAQRPNINFGSMPTGGAPAVAQSVPYANQTSSLPPPQVSNPRITSPAASPSPIPQPAPSGGRPPSGLHGQGNGLSFGSMGGDANINMRNVSQPQMMAGGPVHLRRESSQSSDMGNPGMQYPVSNRGGYMMGGGGRGRGGYNAGYQPQMSFSPGPGYRQVPNQGRPGQPYPAQFQNQMGPLPGSPHPPRSPALGSHPNTPQMQPSQMYGNPNLPPQPSYGQYAQHLAPQQGQFGAQPPYDPNYSYYGANPYPVPPNYLQQQPPPGSPSFRGGMPSTPQQYGPAKYPQPPSQNMSRTSSQLSERPASSLGGHQPPGNQRSHTPSGSTGTPAPAATSNFKIPERGNKGIQIKAPDGQVVTFEKKSSSPAPPATTSSPSPAPTSSAPTPPEPAPSSAAHTRTESKPGKSAAEIKAEFLEQVKRGQGGDKIKEETETPSASAEESQQKAAEQEVKAEEHAAKERTAEALAVPLDDVVDAAAEAVNAETLAGKPRDEPEPKPTEEAPSTEEAEPAEEAEPTEESEPADEPEPTEEGESAAEPEPVAVPEPAEVPEPSDQPESTEQPEPAEEADPVKDDEPSEAEKSAEEPEQSTNDEDEAERLQREEEERMIAEMEAAEREEEEREKAFQEKKKKDAEAQAAKEKEAAAHADEEMRRLEREAEEAEELRERQRDTGDEEESEEAKAEREKMFASLKRTNLGPGTESPSGTATPASDDSGPPAVVSQTPKATPPTSKPKPSMLKLDTTKPVEPAQPTAGMQSLKSARLLQLQHEAIRYPAGIQSPNPALNQASRRGGRLYDKSFLLQFQDVFKEKPSVDWELKLKETVGDPSDSSAPKSARTPSGMGNRQPSARGPQPAPFQGMGNFSQGGRTLPPGTTSQARFEASSRGMGPNMQNPIAPHLGRAGAQFPMGGIGNTPMARSGSLQNIPTHVQSPRMGGASQRGSRTASRRGDDQRVPSKREQEQQNKAMPLTAGLDLKALETSGSGWKPPSVGRVNVATTDPSGHLPPDMVQRKVKANLNKMTPERFEKIADQILAIAAQSKDETDGRTLRQVIALTFEKACDEAHWASMYAKFCFRMLDRMSDDIKDENVKDKNGNPVVGGPLFRKYLLNRCQEEFERGWDINLPEKGEGQTEEAAILSDEYYVAAAAKRKGLGLVQFIGELYKLRMLSIKIMHQCFTRLLNFEGMPDESAIESLNKLLRTVGAAMDSADNGPPLINTYFERIEKIMNMPGLPSRMYFMLLDTVDLRRANWHSKDDSKGPKTIQEIREEAALAQQAAEAEKLRQNQRGGGGRMQPGRGDARNMSGGPMPPPDYPKNQVGTDDLRKLSARTSGRQQSSGPGRSMGPTSMFQSRSSSGRQGLGPNTSLLSRGDDSSSSSRAASQREKKDDEAKAGANAFSALAGLDASGTGVDTPGSSPPVTKAQPALQKSADAGEPTAAAADAPAPGSDDRPDDA